MIRAALLFFFIASGAPAAQVDRCESPQTQADMNQCAYEEYVKADHALNSLYGRLMKSLPAERQKQLKEAQRAWLKFRDLECVFQAGDSEGGSIHPLEVSTCMTELSVERTKHLANVMTE